MRAVIQRVSEASVVIGEQKVADINQGLLIFLRMLIEWLRNLILMTSTIKNAGIKSIMELDSRRMHVQKLA